MECKKKCTISKKWYDDLLTKISLSCPADMIILTDDGSHSKELLKQFNKKTATINVWRNGIDRPNVDFNAIESLRRSCGIGANHIVLLTVSRLSADKRVDRAIRLLQHIPSEYKNTLKLIIVGDGPERVNLESLARQLGVLDITIFAGSIWHENIYSYYSVADIFLSLYDATNVGNPLLEALNAGKGIVTLNNGETAEVIKNGENGILVDVAEDDNLLAAHLGNVIGQLIKDRAYLHLLGKNAERYAKTHLWTWDERLQTELTAILELVN